MLSRAFGALLGIAAIVGCGSTAPDARFPVLPDPHLGASVDSGVADSDRSFPETEDASARADTHTGIGGDASGPDAIDAGAAIPAECIGGVELYHCDTGFCRCPNS